MTTRGLDTPWWAEARARPMAAVARELGLRSTGGRGVTPCPACGADYRTAGDKRGAVYAGPDGGWFCVRCNAKGSTIDLVAYRLTGGRLDAKNPASAGPVRAWYAARGWCEPDPRADGVQVPPVARVPVPPAAPPEPPKRATPAELEALWSQCLPVGDHPEVLAYLAHRVQGTKVAPIDAWRLEDLGLVRVLPRTARVPSWAHGWIQGDYRLIVQTFDAAGQWAGVRGRYIGKGSPPDGRPKARAPTGLDAGGLVLACPLGRQILATGAIPAWWPKGTPLGILVCEGEPDWWRTCTRYSEAAETAPAVLSLPGSGAWTAELAARIPSGADVVTCTDDDPGGLRLAQQVWESLGARCNNRDWLNRGGGSNGRT
jgi:hypothetical protein